MHSLQLLITLLMPSSGQTSPFSRILEILDQMLAKILSLTQFFFFLNYHCINKIAKKWW